MAALRQGTGMIRMNLSLEFILGGRGLSGLRVAQDHSKPHSQVPPESHTPRVNSKSEDIYSQAKGFPRGVTANAAFLPSPILNSPSEDRGCEHLVWLTLGFL